MPQRPMPADFATHAATETNNELMSRYDCSSDLITRWRKATGVRSPYSTPAGRFRVMPPGFRLTAGAMTIKDLKERYGVSEATINRWCAEAGIEPPKPVYVVGSSTRHFNPVTRLSRDTSAAGLAADFLQRFGPVVRCDANGRVNPNGTHWRRGSFVLTADEIIDRAKRNGWRPDAWKELAAA